MGWAWVAKDVGPSMQIQHYGVRWFHKDSEATVRATVRVTMVVMVVVVVIEEQVLRTMSGTLGLVFEAFAKPHLPKAGTQNFTRSLCGQTMVKHLTRSIVALFYSVGYTPRRL